MIITKHEIQTLKKIPNSGYDAFKQQFLFHSNKMEGSTFSLENINKAVEKGIIEGEHTYNDVIETMNSIKLFDFVIDTLDEQLTKRLIIEYQDILKRNTLDHERGLSGKWKSIPNMISNTDLELAQPYEVDEKMEQLLYQYNSSNKDKESIIQFHVQFEKIHPFQDGNGRVGRFIMIRECIVNEAPLIVIDEKYEREYKNNLYVAQKYENYKPLNETINKCIHYFDKKCKILKISKDYLKGEKKRDKEYER